MRQKISTLAIIGMLSFFISGCHKNEVSLSGKVELYLLDSYSKINNSSQIDEKTVKIKSSALISYENFISYDSENYIFQISDKARKAIDEIKHSVHGVAFGIKANETLVYTGYFWPSISSASCDWIVIDPVMIHDNKIKVSLGYPGLIQGQCIPDNRNDSRIIKIFENDNKLIK